MTLLLALDRLNSVPFFSPLFSEFYSIGPYVMFFTSSLLLVCFIVLLTYFLQVILFQVCHVCLFIIAKLRVEKQTI